MVMTISEAWPSRVSTAGPEPSIELIYIIHGTDDDNIAQQALEEASDPTYEIHAKTVPGKLPISSIVLRRNRTVERIGEDIWKGTVFYGIQEDKQFRFSTRGGQEHIVQSLETVGKYSLIGDDTDVPETNGMIGETDDNVEGVDIVVPMFQFSEVHHLEPALVTHEYLSKLYYLTGCVNSAPFQCASGTFAAGEVLFLGAEGEFISDDSGQIKQDDRVTISFEFAARPNRKSGQGAWGPIRIGGKTIEKEGWQYLWVRHKTKDQKGENVAHTGLMPAYAYVERVQPPGDFGALAISPES